MKRTQRVGYTLLELVVVLVLLLIMAVALLPTIPGLFGNSRQQAAADVIQTRIAEARAKAIENSQAFRFSIHQDGTRVRLAPDNLDSGEAAPGDSSSFLSPITEDTLQQATADVVTDPDGMAPAVDAGGWITVATFQPDGTCKEVGASIVVRQLKFAPIRIDVRGMTGTARATTLGPEDMP